MKLDAKLDVDVLAVQQEDEVTCLLTFEAPVPSDAENRPGESLIVVVDRSGSMSGAPLASVRASLHALVDRLKPQDSFGVVIFDDEAAIAVPTRALRDHHLPTVHSLIEGIQAGGSTDLSGGYLLGLAEARRHRGATGSTVLLLSDGHANAGITDPLVVGRLGAQARAEQITTGTIGIGSGYDETLLAELATQGSGPHRFAFTPDDAVAVLAEESGDLLSKAIANAFVRIVTADPGLLEGIGTVHSVPRWIEEQDDGRKALVIPLGDLYAGERRELLVQFSVPALAALGHQELATFTIDYIALPDLLSQAITWPMAVNVVPGDEAAGRIPDPTVRTARLLAEATRAKHQASEALESGDTERASALMAAEALKLGSAIEGIDPATPEAAVLRARLAEEQQQAEKLARSARDQEAGVSRKSLMEDINMESRGRNDETRRRRSREKRDF